MTQNILKHHLSFRNVEVSPETLRRAGLNRVIAKAGISEQGILVLKHQLPRCESSHSWKGLVGPDFCFEKIQSYENNKRPTFIFSYYGDNDIYIGSASVALKINHNFPYDGFPVIARAFINEDFRNYRLYSPMVTDRVEFCRAYFSDKLNGIHMGSNNPRIYGLIKSSRKFKEFVHIGSEKLDDGVGTSLVRDYLLPSTKLIEYFETEHKNASHPLIKTQILQAAIDTVGGRLQDRSRFVLESFAAEFKSVIGHDLAESDPKLNSLISLLQAIPVISTETDLVDTNPVKFVERRKLPLKKAG